MHLSFWREAALGRNPRRTLVRIAVLVVISIAVFGWVLIPVRTYGDSMLPTYRSGSFHLVNRVPYLFRQPARGDVVALQMAGWSVVYVKRIVGLPGESIGFRDGLLTVNGKALIEPYVRQRATWNMRETTLARGEYFVVGDNRGMRIEEHEFGRVTRGRIAGPLLF